MWEPNRSHTLKRKETTHHGAKYKVVIMDSTPLTATFTLHMLRLIRIGFWQRPKADKEGDS